MPWAPVAFVTATTGRNAKAVIDTAQRLFRQSRERVTTARLNDVLRATVEANQPPRDARGKPVRLFYATQVETGPPTIVIATSAPRAVTEPYRRYLLNAFRQALPYREVPIRMLLRGRTARPTEPG